MRVFSANIKTSIPLCYLLQDVRYPQPSNPITLDNGTAYSFIKSNITQKQSKFWEMRYIDGFVIKPH